MSIFDRLGRLTRSEVTEMKRVLREARDERRAGGRVGGDPWDDRAGYEADIAAADAELARALGDPLDDVFARELGTGRSGEEAGGWGATDADMARGASLWGSGGDTGAVGGRDGTGGAEAAWSGGRSPSANAPEPRVDGRPVAAGWVEVPGGGGGANSGANPWSREPGEVGTGRGAEAPRPAPGRTEAIPREVREAYAVLELPLGSDKARIEQAYRTLVMRYHPDHHAHDSELQRTATNLTIRLREAKDLLFDWLEGRRG